MSNQAAKNTDFIAAEQVDSNQSQEDMVSDWYAEQVRMFPDPKLTFLNYGYLKEFDDFLWLKKEDVKEKCSISLIHNMVGDMELAGKSVLEVGSGRGGNCSYLARYTKAEKIVGLDYCDAHVDFCRSNNHFNHVSFLQGDAQDLPFDDESFDVVINIESSHAYPNLDAFGESVYGVLKQGGTFLYADTMLGTDKHELSEGERKGVEYFTKDIHEFEKMIQASGFKVRDEQDITGGVIRSLESEEGSLRKMLKTLLDDKRKEPNASISEQSLYFLDVMFDFLENTGLSAYRKRHLIYRYWNLVKI